MWKQVNMFYFKGYFKAMEDACILDMNDPFEKVIHYNIFSKFSKFVLWINMLQFGIDIRLGGSMNVDIFRTTMYWN